MAANPQDLANEAQCYDCLGPVTTAQAYRLALERRTLLELNASAVTDAQTLITYATCYLCLGMSQADAVEMALLDQISQLV
jgi:hypothetical protein